MDTGLVNNWPTNVCPTKFGYETCLQTQYWLTNIRVDQLLTKNWPHNWSTIGQQMCSLRLWFTSFASLNMMETNTTVDQLLTKKWTRNWSTIGQQMCARVNLSTKRAYKSQTVKQTDVLTNCWPRIGHGIGQQLVNRCVPCDCGLQALLH